MDIYIMLCFLFLFGGYLLYNQVRLERKIKQVADLHKKSLADAGNAITDTLKIAFDNLKRNSSEHNKINGKLTEHNSRIHRLEQHTNRSPRENINKDVQFQSDEDEKQKRTKI